IGFSVITFTAVQLILQQLVSSGILVAPLLFTKSILVSFGAIMFMLQTAIRCIPRIYRWFLINNSKDKDLKRALVIGAGNTGAAIVRRLKDDRSEGILPVAFIDDDVSKHGIRISGVKVAGTLEDLPEVVSKYHAMMIIISLHNLSDSALSEVIRVCSATGLTVKLYKDLSDADADSVSHRLKDFNVEDLLFRPMVKPDMQDVEAFVNGKTVLVTGGAGSIGSELCRQVLNFGCKKLYIFDIHENGLFDIDAELKKKYAGRYELRLGSIRDKARVDSVLSEARFDIVIHAAAHKHVPMMEINPIEAVKNNVFGTRNVIRSCTEHGVGRFVMISTDKAVHPTNIMGATKRVCELMVKAYDGVSGCEMCAVRFGNVLGSNGSVIPTFRRQIAEGGPVTVTHKDITRFFMTIPEAVSLVLCAGKRAKGGEIFVLNMEKPIRIYDLAVNMIRLSGMEPERDIKIEFTGLRPGEKLYEELSFANEDVTGTDHTRIYVVGDVGRCRESLDSDIDALVSSITYGSSPDGICDSVFRLIGENIKENGNDSSKLHATIKVGEGVK
ncbi:MAG: polysaccharide biosynthesis protein, partial [Clostridia bacterium]|nr:polysaccharide biosynthesis protein [Clostridia bacterium]